MCDMVGTSQHLVPTLEEGFLGEKMELIIYLIHLYGKYYWGQFFLVIGYLELLEYWEIIASRRDKNMQEETLSW